MITEPSPQRIAQLGDLFQWQPIENTFVERQQQGQLMRHRKRRELRLRKYCANAPAVLDNPFRALVHHAAEAGEDFELQELSVFETQSFRRLPHGRDLAL